METSSKTIPPTERPPRPPVDVLLEAGLSVTQIAVLVCVLGQTKGKGIELPARSHFHEHEGTPTRVKSLPDCAALVALRQNGLQAELIRALQVVADQSQQGKAVRAESQGQSNARLERTLRSVGGWRTY